MRFAGIVEPIDEVNVNSMETVSTETIRVALLGNERLLVETLAQRLADERGFDVISSGNNANNAIQTCLDQKPEVAIFNVDHDGRETIDAAAEIHARQRTTRFLFLTNALSDIAIEQILRVGAFGLLLKSEPYAFVKEAIARINRGDYCFSQPVESRIQYDRERHAYSMRSEGRLSSLTNRQLEVLKHLATGRSVKEVAKQMHLSEKSVDSHKYRIMNKLGIHDRVELALFAVREGLVNP